jgi:rRNA maturation endonuclease Nob1
MPGMKAAYHQQCIGCHDRMEMKKTKECTDCHKKKQ